MYNIGLIIVLLILSAGGILLQIRLSKAKSKWLGLILPLICFLFSIVMVLSVSMYSTETVTQSIDGVIISQETNQMQAEKPTVGETLAKVIPVFITSNIPTLILLGIYFACRGKEKKKKDLEKMSIQDLE